MPSIPKSPLIVEIIEGGKVITFYKTTRVCVEFVCGDMPCAGRPAFDCWWYYETPEELKERVTKAIEMEGVP